jgi:hypothetical protein
MDELQFDRWIRSFGTIKSRRATTRFLAGGVLGVGLITLGATRAETKHGKGGGKKGGKGKCGRGKKKCGNRCISEAQCCDTDECFDCARESCIDGTCQCDASKGQLRDASGFCGEFPFGLKGVGEICTSNDECVSGLCNAGIGGPELRCNRGTSRCLTAFDCVSQVCKGYACPELYAIQTGNKC